MSVKRSTCICTFFCTLEIFYSVAVKNYLVYKKMSLDTNKCNDTIQLQRLLTI